MHNISCRFPATQLNTRATIDALTKDFILQNSLMNISRNVAFIRRTSCIRFK